MPCVTDLIKANELGKKNMQVSNEPAFPSGLMSDDSKPNEVSSLHNGITIRDYFAAKAMQAYIEAHNRPTSTSMRNEIVSLSYAFADAMLKERMK